MDDGLLGFIFANLQLAPLIISDAALKRGALYTLQTHIEMIVPARKPATNEAAECRAGRS